MMLGCLFALVACVSVHGQHQPLLRQENQLESLQLSQGMNTIGEALSTDRLVLDSLQSPQTKKLAQLVDTTRDNAIITSTAQNPMQSYTSQLDASHGSVLNGGDRGEDVVLPQSVPSNLSTIISDMNRNAAFASGNDVRKVNSGLRGSEHQLPQTSQNVQSLSALEQNNAPFPRSTSLVTIAEDQNESTHKPFGKGDDPASFIPNVHLPLNEQVPLVSTSSSRSNVLEPGADILSQIKVASEGNFVSQDAARQVGGSIVNSLQFVETAGNQPTKSTLRQRLSSHFVYPDHVTGYATHASLLRQSSSAEGSSPKHGKFSVDQEVAECLPLQPHEKRVSATWLSSYPGSGSKLTRQMIESVTGLSTGTDLDSNGQVANGFAVAVNTHFPSHTKMAVFKKSESRGISRAILVMRNPMFAINSFFRSIHNLEHQSDQALGSEYSQSDAWVAWKHENFDAEVKLWVKHTRWWMSNYTRENLHLLPYEYLSSPERGSDELQKLGNFLASLDKVVAANLLDPAKFCCVWEKVVDRASIAASEQRRLVYTEIELESLIQALIKLRDSHKTFREFYLLMQEYLGIIVDEKKALVARNQKPQ